jgi:hypothetical protein
MAVVAVWEADSQWIMRLEFVQTWHVDQHKIACASRVYYGYFMWLRNWWGSKVFKHCFIIQSVRPCTSLFVGLTAAHVFSPSGFPIVALLGKVATQTGVSAGDLVPVCPAVSVWRRVETALTSSFCYFLFQKSLKFP